MAAPASRSAPAAAASRAARLAAQMLAHCPRAQTDDYLKVVACSSCKGAYLLLCARAPRRPPAGHSAGTAPARGLAELREQQLTTRRSHQLSGQHGWLARCCFFRRATAHIRGQAPTLVALSAASAAQVQTPVQLCTGSRRYTQALPAAEDKTKETPLPAGRKKKTKGKTKETPLQAVPAHSTSTSRGNDRCATRCRRS